jgi:hypothetical protein
MTNAPDGDGVTRNATERYKEVQLPGVPEGGSRGIPDPARNDAEETEVERRMRLNRERQQRFRNKRKAAKAGKSAPNRVTPRNAGTEETRKDKSSPATSGEGPAADLPPSDPGRERVLAPADAPHLYDQAKRVAAHYGLAVGRPSMAKGAADVAVMDLLAQGVGAELLMRAADVYATYSRLCGTPTASPAVFFAPEGDWREYAKGPPKPPPAPRLVLDAGGAGRLAATGPTPDYPPRGPAKHHPSP